MGWSLAYKGKKGNFDQISSFIPSHLSIFSSLGAKRDYGLNLQLIRNFLWRGGKGNQNRMHLVKWETIKRYVPGGGLQIKDPRLSNIAMGGKLLWQLFSNKKHPVSNIFWKKYLHGGNLRNMNIENTPKGSNSWNLCRKGLYFFVQHLF